MDITNKTLLFFSRSCSVDDKIYVVYTLDDLVCSKQVFLVEERYNITTDDENVKSNIFYREQLLDWLRLHLDDFILDTTLLKVVYSNGK